MDPHLAIVWVSPGRVFKPRNHIPATLTLILTLERMSKKKALKTTIFNLLYDKVLRILNILVCVAQGKSGHKRIQVMYFMAIIIVLISVSPLNGCAVTKKSQP